MNTVIRLAITELWIGVLNRFMIRITLKVKVLARRSRRVQFCLVVKGTPDMNSMNVAINSKEDLTQIRLCNPILFAICVPVHSANCVKTVVWVYVTVIV
jgi:hypothetical protein